MNLEDIGFYTLSNKRALSSSEHTPLQRCEIVLTSRCNFSCPYCRRVGGQMSFDDACRCLDLWICDGLKNVRFSGGEPTLWPKLEDLVSRARAGGVERIALSTNGSAPLDMYLSLIACGIDDFSISLDACCSSMGKIMSGGNDKWDHVVRNIAELSKRVYTTLGIVLTDDNVDSIWDIIALGERLGVADIRPIPTIPLTLSGYSRFPILNYRLSGGRIRGLRLGDCVTCRLALDDMAVCDNKHFPCVIYMREGGAPIGDVDDSMRGKRAEWVHTHNSLNDPICSANCLDVCREYNNVASQR